MGRKKAASNKTVRLFFSNLTLMSRSVGEYIFSNLSSLTVWFISQCKDGQPNEALGWAEVESGFGIILAKCMHYAA